MKKSIYIMVFAPLLAFGQIPVTDAATNGSLGVVNNQLLQVNLQLKSISAQLSSVNQSLERLINLLEKNNNLTSKSKEILKEELEAKKIAPDYVIKSTELLSVVALKDKILEAYRSTQNNIKDYKNLDKKEINEFLSYATDVVMKTQDLFKQCKTILKTKSIIQPEERLKKINDINTKLNEILDGLINYNEKLANLNSTRTIRKTLIELN